MRALHTCALLLIVGAFAISLAPLAIAAEPVVTFETDAQRERYDRLLEEYRCLKCQNQNLAGSNAALAGDLRREIRTQILDGADDPSIDRYLVERYGEFVRYRPRFAGLNTVLWIAPFVLLAIGIAVGVRMARRSQRASTGMGQAPANAARRPDESSIERARQLLGQPRDPG